MNGFGFYNADCMEHLKDFPDKFFDLAIVDPPYGINVFRTANETRSARAKSKAYKKYAGGDMNAPDPEYFRQLQRISRNQIIFGANHIIDNIAAGYSGGGGVPVLDRMGQGKRSERFRRLRTCLHIIFDGGSDLPLQVGGYASG